MIDIIVNGTTEKLPQSISIADYLSQKNYPTNRIAVEKNGEIIPKSQYENVMLMTEDKLEIVTFVGGG